MRKQVHELKYGPVYIRSGKYKGRVVHYDDDDINRAYVYLGHPLISDEIAVSPGDLSEINTSILINRQQELASKLMAFHFTRMKDRELEHYKEQFYNLNEYLYIESLLHQNFIKARFLNVQQGKRIFISHSSKDKTFARFLATDLSNSGLVPWLDEWNIKVGQSIPESISTGLSDCEYVLVILSPSSVESNWVQNEWQSKYWDEIAEGNVKVIPVLLEKCNIPQLLKSKKYADFSNDYQMGLESLLHALID